MKKIPRKYFHPEKIPAPCPLPIKSPLSKDLGLKLVYAQKEGSVNYKKLVWTKVYFGSFKKAPKSLSTFRM
jgi:hypothetical protein